MPTHEGISLYKRFSMDTERRGVKDIFMEMHYYQQLQRWYGETAGPFARLDRCAFGEAKDFHLTEALLELKKRG